MHKQTILSQNKGKFFRQTKMNLFTIYQTLNQEIVCVFELHSSVVPSTPIAILHEQWHTPLLRAIVNYCAFAKPICTCLHKTTELLVKHCVLSSPIAREQSVVGSSPTQDIWIVLK